MREIDVVYLYENIARELDVACAVTAILRDRYRRHVEIAQWPQNVPRLYGKAVPRVVILPFCYFEHSFDCLLEWRKAAFLNLSWEQIFYPGNVRAKTPRGRFAVSHVLHHAWSRQYARFASAQGIPDHHIVVNGQPAYTLYDEPYRRYFVPRHELALRHGLDPAKRWIFFPENYNWAFYSDQMLRFFLAAGQSPEDVEQMRRFCADSFAQVMRWFAALAATGTVEAIIRPRPSTPAEQFRKAVADVVGPLPRHMHINQAETVREWIMASDVVMSSHSTSLIEAVVAGSRAYMVAPFPIPPPLHQEWHDLVPRITTEEEFLAVCLQNRESGEQRALQEWARSTFMSTGDAIENLAAYIDQLAAGATVRPPIPPRLVATAQGDWRRVPKWVWYVFRRLRARYRRFVPLPANRSQVKEFVSADDINARIDRWREVLASAPTRAREGSV